MQNTYMYVEIVFICILSDCLQTVYMYCEVCILETKIVRAAIMY